MLHYKKRDLLNTKFNTYRWRNRHPHITNYFVPKINPKNHGFFPRYYHIPLQLIRRLFMSFLIQLLDKITKIVGLRGNAI